VIIEGSAELGLDGEDVDALYGAMGMRANVEAGARLPFWRLTEGTHFKRVRGTHRSPCGPPVGEITTISSPAARCSGARPVRPQAMVGSIGRREGVSGMRRGGEADEREGEVESADSDREERKTG